MLDALPAEYSARARAWCAVWTFGFRGRPGVWKEQEQPRFMEGSSVLIHVCAIRSRIGLLYSPGKGHVPGMSGSSAAWIRSIQYAWMDGFLARRSAGSIKISSRESTCMNMIPWWLIPCIVNERKISSNLHGCSDIKGEPVKNWRYYWKLHAPIWFNFSQTCCYAFCLVNGENNQLSWNHVYRNNASSLFNILSPSLVHVVSTHDSFFFPYWSMHIFILLDVMVTEAWVVCFFR